MALETASLDRLCELARLNLSPSERERLGAELEQVLDLFAALHAAPVDGLVPLAHPHDLTLRLRDDRVTDGDRADALLALATDAEGGYFLVPKVLE